MRLFFAAAVFAGMLFLIHTDAKAGPDFLNVTECASDDCSAMRAGYAWAKENSISDDEACEDRPEASDAFIKGCEAFVKEGDDGDGNDD